MKEVPGVVSQNCDSDGRPFSTYIVRSDGEDHVDAEKVQKGKEFKPQDIPVYRIFGGRRRRGVEAKMCVSE